MPGDGGGCDAPSGGEPYVCDPGPNGQYYNRYDYDEKNDSQLGDFDKKILLIEVIYN